MGKNGAGKSTLLKIIAGQQTFDRKYFCAQDAIERR
jgi:ABC-type sugar transport system ATPase subunit